MGDSAGLGCLAMAGDRDINGQTVPAAPATRTCTPVCTATTTASSTWSRSAPTKRAATRPSACTSSSAVGSSPRRASTSSARRRRTATSARTGSRATLTWALGKWDGKGTGPQDPPPQQKYTVQTGNPADYKLYQGDIIVIAFLPAGQDAATIANKQNPPSLPNLPGALGVAESGPTSGPATTLPLEAPTNAPASTAPAGSTPPTTTK